MRDRQVDRNRDRKREEEGKRKRRERENLREKIDERQAEVSGTRVAVRSVTPPKLI